MQFQWVALGADALTGSRDTSFQGQSVRQAVFENGLQSRCVKATIEPAVQRINVGGGRSFTHRLGNRAEAALKQAQQRPGLPFLPALLQALFQTISPPAIPARFKALAAVGGKVGYAHGMSRGTARPFCNGTIAQQAWRRRGKPAKL